MDQDGISRPYRLKDVKKCFGQISDAVVLQWYRRGFVAGAMIPRGSRSQFAFSFAEIVHIGVIADMAQYGLTTNAENLLIHTDRNKGLKWGLNPFLLTQPRMFTAIYEKFSYDCCLVFDGESTTITQQAKRNRSQTSTTVAILLSPLEATKELVKWTSGHGPGFEKGRFPDAILRIDDIKLSELKDTGVSYNVVIKTGSALALIYIPRLAEEAAAALQLPNPWKRQPSAHDETIRQEIIERLETW